ncbi:MAG: hypothetical protein GTO12_08425 [Proteobacteria bacterium]|nr:hypothetical protein [Pseudomonadota bacterium]
MKGYLIVDVELEIDFGPADNTLHVKTLEVAREIKGSLGISNGQKVYVFL